MALNIDDDGSALAVRSFFREMGLPVPQKSEFYECSDGKRSLIFLSDYALVIRVTPQDQVMKSNNPHFIKSLFNRQAGHYQIDIDPGYECDVTKGEAKTIFSMLRRKYSVLMADEKAQNLCFVPKTEPRFPVMIDLDPNFVEFCPSAIGMLSDAVRAVKSLLSGAREAVKPESNPQDEIYAPLREIITNAWPECRSVPNPAGISAFFRACQEFKRAGMLVASWENNSYHGTAETAALYQERLACEAKGLSCGLT